MNDDTASRLPNDLESRKVMANGLKDAVRKLRAMLDTAEQMAELPDRVCTEPEHEAWGRLYDSLKAPAGDSIALDGPTGSRPALEIACFDVKEMVEFLGDLMMQEAVDAYPEGRAA